MLDFRSPLIIAPAPAGVVLGVLIWLVLGGPGAPLRAIEAAAPPSSSRTRPAGEAGESAASSLAGLPPMMGAQAAGPDVSVRLEGLVRRPGRIAALLAFNGGPPVWVTLGDTQSGMTLVDVSSASVILESVRGPVELKVGEATGATPATPPASGDDPPAGARIPPEPNSAPQG